MSKTSPKSILKSIHKLNEAMDIIATMGQNILQRLNDIDYTSVTDISTQEQLNIAFDEIGEKFRNLSDIKEELMYGLQRKVLEEIDAMPLRSKTKSLSIKRKLNSYRKTRRAKSI
jgi:uncharacterized lipoprotein YehR (DUF1307 family)